MKRLQVSILLLLVVSSSIAFPAYAAEQLGYEKPMSIFDFIRGVVAKFFDRSNDDSTESISSNPASSLIDSLKALEHAAINYKENPKSQKEFLSAAENFITVSNEFSSQLRSLPVELELKQNLQDFNQRVAEIKQKALRQSLTKAEIEGFISEISTSRGVRSEKVEFERFEEREIHPRVLGAGGSVTVAGGKLTLPPSVNSSLPLPEDYQPEELISPEIQALANKLEKILRKYTGGF